MSITTTVHPAAQVAALSWRHRLRGALLPTVLFWAGWAALRWGWPQARWTVPAAQMWLAYSLAWCVLPGRRWPLWVPLAAALGSMLGLLWLPVFAPGRLLDPAALARHALPATAFALLMHLPLRWWRWREEQALQLRLDQAEQTAALAQLSRQVSVAELKALQAQVEPHFLFNALASLQQLIRRQPAVAERFLGELHDYLRLALPSMREPLSTVDKELALARAYLTVMITRLGERLHFVVQADTDCAAHPMPPMMLLTLVENAVRHGIEPQAAGGRIEIEARREGAALVLEVRDDGAGLSSGPDHHTAGQGVGLANVRDRLASLYGTDAHLTVQQRTPGGVCSRIRLPWNPPATAPASTSVPASTSR